MENPDDPRSLAGFLGKSMRKQETVFVFPWAVVMKELGMVAFIEILIFFFILGLGLIYAWKKNALKWE